MQKLLAALALSSSLSAQFWLPTCDNPYVTYECHDYPPEFRHIACPCGTSFCFIFKGTVGIGATFQLIETASSNPYVTVFWLSPRYVAQSPYQITEPPFWCRDTFRSGGKRVSQTRAFNLDPALAFPVVQAGPLSSILTVRIPNDPVLRGTSYYVQAFHLESWGVPGIATSSIALITIP